MLTIRYLGFGFSTNLNEGWTSVQGAESLAKALGISLKEAEVSIKKLGVDLPPECQICIGPPIQVDFDTLATHQNNDPRLKVFQVLRGPFQSVFDAKEYLSMFDLWDYFCMTMRRRRTIQRDIEQAGL